MRRGFTLIETLIGLAVSAFLVSGTAGLMLRAAHLKKRSDVLTAAAGLVRGRLALLRAQAFDDAELAAGIHEEVLTDRSTGCVFRLTWTVEPQEEALKDVLLKAAPDRTAGRGFEARLLISKSLGF